MEAIVQQAMKVKAQFSSVTVKAEEDPEVVKARDLAHGVRLKHEAIERRIRELAQTRAARVALNGAGIDDEFAKLLAKELGKATAALTAEHLQAEAVSSSCLSDEGRYDPNNLIDEADVGSDEEDEGYVRLRDVKWPDDPVEVNDWVSSSDSDSERSFRFTPRDERVYEEEKAPQYFERVLTAAYVPPPSRLQLDGPPGRGCAVLELGKNQIGGKGCAYVCGWLKVSALHTLVLSDNPLGDSGVTLLGRAVIHATQLRCLALQRCGATEYGVRHLAAGVGRSSSLRQLWLMDNDSRCDGARHLASALAVAGCNLTELGLERNKVGAAGAQALAAALAARRCPLAKLRLQHNPLGAEGVAALARALERNTQLHVLKLRGCGAGDVGGLALAHALGSNRSLVALGLEDNDLTLLCLRSLRQAMLAGGALQRLSFDLSQGGVFTRPRDEADLRSRCAPPSPPPPRKHGQRRREAEQAAVAAAKRRDWSQLVLAVGAVDEFGDSTLGRVKQGEIGGVEGARLRRPKLLRRTKSKGEDKAAALQQQQQQLQESLGRKSKVQAKGAGKAARSMALN